jgi:hypothetical protein
MDSVVALVQIVKKYEEDGCETFIRDWDTKITGRWIRKEEKTLFKIRMLYELRLDSAT